ncbi:hypothetical protein TELCIR_00689 [Teladorsagia circumcincta]|uniref:Uncharacterized protein n=1 Tax=Teladorsagia circumcincta TaxID=45464 RepID=A0A2G9V404_TELCI|nr:hypothetical protein TELCIR_00689 [Teladorsagia circumcincta]
MALVALAFRERLVRVYDVRSYECSLEENAVRTAATIVVKWSSRYICESLRLWVFPHEVVTNAFEVFISELVLHPIPKTLAYFFKEASE